MALTLIIGGARSGKSELAQRLAVSSGRPVVFVATMQPLDDEVRSRITTHRAARPAEWRTIEEPLDLPAALESIANGRVVVIDCLTLWTSNMLMSDLGEAVDTPADKIEAAVSHAVERAAGLATWCARYEGDVIVVSNEVGLGVVPPYPLGRAFRDALGATNASFATEADRVLQCTAGMVLDLRALGASSVEQFVSGGDV